MFEDAVIKVVLVLVTGLGLGAVHGWLYRSAKVDASGWHWLRPGFMHHLVVLGISAVAALMWWAYLLVGSVRENTATQVAAIAVIAAAITVGALIVWWNYYLRRVGWCGTILRVRAIGKEATYDLEKLCKIDLRNCGETIVLRFSDRRKVSYSADMHGADELTEHIYRTIF